MIIELTVINKNYEETNILCKAVVFSHSYAFNFYISPDRNRIKFKILYSFSTKHLLVYIKKE